MWTNARKGYMMEIVVVTDKDFKDHRPRVYNPRFEAKVIMSQVIGN